MVGRRVESWLAEFEDALTTRDAERAAGLFAPTSFWAGPDRVHTPRCRALQLKARAEGVPTPVYELQEVHHTS